MAFRLPAMPVRTGDDASLNFDAVARRFDAETRAWVPLILVTAVEFNGGLFEPAGRLEQSDSVVRLRGLLKAKAGKEVVGGATIFTVAEAQRSPKIAIVHTITIAGGVRYLQVETNGEVKLALGTLKEGEQLILDGLTYSRS